MIKSKNLFFIIYSLFIAHAIASSSHADDQLVSKKYVDEGLATKQSVIATTNKGGQTLLVNSAANGFIWSPIEATGAAFSNATPIAADGWEIIANETSMRKDLRDGMVALNLTVRKTDSALTMPTSGTNSYVLVATLPREYWLAAAAYSNLTWIMTPVVGVSVGTKPNPLTMWMNKNGQIQFYNYASASKTIAVGSIYSITTTYQAGL
jgi:hypothetical protein